MSSKEKVEELSMLLSLFNDLELSDSTIEKNIDSFFSSDLQEELDSRLFSQASYEEVCFFYFFVIFY